MSSRIMTLAYSKNSSTYSWVYYTRFDPGWKRFRNQWGVKPHVIPIHCCRLNVTHNHCIHKPCNLKLLVKGNVIHESIPDEKDSPLIRKSWGEKTHVILTHWYRLKTVSVTHNHGIQCSYLWLCYKIQSWIKKDSSWNYEVWKPV